ncbi:MAG: hypothetical protein JST40_06065 [Armatimonadetes bacterium]|nr:hypothetical protein [Armatimonadota bacterium]
MNKVFQPEWRTQNRTKRRFYAKYMSWLEKGGYFVVLCVFAAFIFAFNYKVEDVISADNVKIEPFSIPLEVTDDVMVLRLLAPDGSEVRSGQAIAEVVQGAAQIEKYLDPKIARPVPTTLVAPTSGTLRIDSKPGSRVAKGTFARIVDYSRLQMSPELEGTSVAKAAVGQKARITAINTPSPGDTLFRGSFQKEDLLSGGLMGDAVKEKIQKSIEHTTVRLRDDQPLELKDLKQIQVDADIKLAPGGTKSTATADPPAGFSLFGTVESGTHQGTVQIADLPSELDRVLQETVRSQSVGREIRSIDGNSWKIEDVTNIRFVVQAKADGSAAESKAPINATILNRKFAAKVNVDSPPEFLLRAVKEADQQGKSVTARVELVTGTKPIAFILLKRS